MAKKVCYDVISMMMLIVNNRVLESFKFLTRILSKIKFDLKANILTGNGEGVEFCKKNNFDNFVNNRVMEMFSS